jgi:hypothetical protein
MVTINCLRGVPKITYLSTPKITITNIFSKRASLVAIVAAAASFSSMSYDTELAAAKKAASLAARLCQAPLSLSLSFFFLVCLARYMFV